MADKFVGFQGTVDEVQWATLMAGIGQKYTLIAGDPVRASGRVVSIDPRAQIGCGVLFEHDAVKTVTVPTPATGQWHLLVARRVWSSRTVSYVLVAGNVTADATQTAPPATLPAARNKTVGLTDDEPIAWIHARASVTTLSLWQMSVKRNGRVPGLWAMFDPDEQGIYRIVSDADGATYTWSGGVWGASSPADFQLNTTNSKKSVVTQHGIGFIMGTAAPTTTKNVVFPRAFKEIPVLQINYIGGKNSSDFSPEGLLDVAPAAHVKGYSPTLAGFTAMVRRTDGANNAAGWGYYFAWSATGVVA